MPRLVPGAVSFWSWYWRFEHRPGRPLPGPACLGQGRVVGANRHGLPSAASAPPALVHGPAAGAWVGIEDGTGAIAGQGSRRLWHRLSSCRVQSRVQHQNGSSCDGRCQRGKWQPAASVCRPCVACASRVLTTYVHLRYDPGCRERAGSSAEVPGQAGAAPSHPSYLSVPFLAYGPEHARGDCCHVR